MPPKSDAQLLREYAEHGSEAAFAEIASRHTNLVYSAALRQVDSPDLAAEGSQRVFIALAHGAGSLLPKLTGHASLAGWLCRCARNMSLNLRRDEFRRQSRERLAMEHHDIPEATADWDHLRPLLDEAMSELNGPDYEALVMRFFQNQDLRSVGHALGLSDNTAQKRVSRALDKLRERLARRGITTTSAALTVTLSANAVHAAPVGLSATVCSAAALPGPTLGTTATITKAIAMTTFQKIAITAALTGAIGGGIYEARQAATLRTQNDLLVRQQAPMAAQINQLQQERDNTSNRLADLLAENSLLKTNPRELELLKLRGQVTGLEAGAQQADDPLVKKALRWKANVEKMKQLFAEHPEQRVPEMQFLSDDYFFDLARDQDLESSNGVRKAFSEIRQRAKNVFAPMLQQALNAFIDANGGQLPARVSDLKPYFQNPVDDAVLAQYKMLFTGNVSDFKGNFVLKDKQVTDPEHDYPWQIGPNAYGPDASAFETAQFASSFETLKPVIEAFSAANGGSTPSSLSQLKSYITTPEQQAAYDKLSKDGVNFGRPK